MKKNCPSLIWNNWNIYRQCILKEKKDFIVKQTETSCNQNNIWDINIFCWYSKKSATSVDKCDDEKKKMAHPWSETNETFVDNVFWRRKRVPLRNRLRWTVTKTIYGINFFLSIPLKRRDRCRQVWRWKKLANPWSETSVTFVDNVIWRRRIVTKTLYGINIFGWYSKKKRDKCRQLLDGTL